VQRVTVGRRQPIKASPEFGPVDFQILDARLQKAVVSARQPEQRGVGTRLEFRMPDPSCNGYLATAVQLAAGLDGIENKIDPGPPLDTNVWQLSDEERERIGLEVLPANLGEAVEELEANEVMKDALGDHIFEQFVSRKKAEWSDYVASVSEWELEQYINY